MKKLIIVLGICAILTCMPMVTSSPINLFKHRGLTPRIALQTNGTFSGIFAEKNETGYNVLGNISGTYSAGVNWSFGTIEGIWTMNDGNGSGYFNGYMFHKFLFGQYNITGGDSNWFIGVFKLNETSNEFKAISIVFTDDYPLIRYALGSYT